MLRLRVLFAAAAALFIAAGAAATAGPGNHHDGNGGARGIGVLNAVDAENGKVNISHEPIPALKWPEMTMDLPVTAGVDLGDFGKGDKVQCTVEQNEAKVYQITAMCTTDKDEVTEGLCAERHAHDGGAHHDDNGHQDHD